MSMSLAGQDRAAACWQHQDCGACVHEKQGCGWCPSSSVCVPASSLLDPVSNNVCSAPGERFELRTKALGCGCSTTTLLSVIVTVFATIAALALLYGLFAAIRAVDPFLGTGQGTGWEIKVEEDGTRTEQEWWRTTRLGRKIRDVLHRPNLQNRSEQEARTERSRLLG